MNWPEGPREATLGCRPLKTPWVKGQTRRAKGRAKGVHPYEGQRAERGGHNKGKGRAARCLRKAKGRANGVRPYEGQRAGWSAAYYDCFLPLPAAPGLGGRFFSRHSWCL